MTTEVKPELSIIIPTKNRNEIFLQTLEKVVEAIKEFNAEVIVVNDSNLELDIPLNFKDKILIYNNNERGVAAARNLGALHAQSDLLLFLDNDMWLSKANIIAYFNFHKVYPEATLNLNWEYPNYLKLESENKALGRYLIKKEFTSLRGWCKGLNWNDTELFESSGLAGANLLISKSNYELINGYDETFPGIGMEDYDFNIRVKKAGIKTYIDPNSMMYHNEANKMELKGWLKKNYESNFNTKHAINIGYVNLKMNQTFYKRTIYFCLIPFSGLLIFCANLLSKSKYLDIIYQKLVDILTGLYIYKGYNKFSL